ncbi:MAG: hypothetical protein ACXAAH_12840, partial [Promethearchaeota archaeon]
VLDKIPSNVLISEEIVSYRVNIHIETVIPYEDSVDPRYRSLDAQYGDTNLGFQYAEDTILDTTISDRARTVLAQTTSYLISDYISVHTLALEVSQSQAEKEYTAHITRISTLITSLILIIPTILSAGTMSGLTTATKIAAKETVKVTVKQAILRAVLKTAIIYPLTIPIQVYTEEFEELYIDPWIESEMLKLAVQTGTPSEVAEFWSSFLSSFREAFFGAASFFVKSLAGTESDQNIDPDVKIEADTGLGLQGLGTEQNIDMIAETSNVDHSLDLQQDVGQTIETLSSQEQEITNAKSRKITDYFKALVDSKRIFSILFSLPSFFVGGGGMATMAQLFDFGSDVLFEMEVDRAIHNKFDLDPLINELVNKRKSFEIFSNVLQERITKTQSVKVGSAIKTLDPLQAMSMMTSAMFHDASIDSGLLMKKEELEKNIKKVGNLETTSKESHVDQIGENPEVGGFSVDNSRMEGVAIEDPDSIYLNPDYEGDIYQTHKGPGFLDQEIPQFLDYLKSKYRGEVFDTYLADYSQPLTQEQIEKGDFSSLEKIQIGEVIINKDGERQVIYDKTEEGINTLRDLFKAKDMDTLNPSEFFILVPRESSGDLQVELKGKNVIEQTVEQNLGRVFRGNIRNLYKILDFENNYETTKEFCKVLDRVTKSMIDQFILKDSDLKATKPSLKLAWANEKFEWSSNKNDKDQEVKYLEGLADSFIDDINKILRHGTADAIITNIENIEKAIQINLLRYLSTCKVSGSDSNIIHQLKNTQGDIILDGLLNNLKLFESDNELLFNTPKTLDKSRVFLESIISSLLEVKSFTVSSKDVEQKFRHTNQFESGNILELTSTLHLLPQELLSRYQESGGKYEFSYRKLWSLHTAVSSQIKELIFGPAGFFSTLDHGRFDVFGRQYLLNENGDIMVLSNPAKNTVGGKKGRNFKTSIIGLDVFRNIYESLLECIQDPSKFTPDTITEIYYNSPIVSSNELD